MEKRNRLVETDLQKVIKQVIRKEKHNNQLTLENRNLKGGYHKENLNEQEIWPWLINLFSGDEKEAVTDASASFDLTKMGKEAGIGFLLQKLGFPADLAAVLRIPLSNLSISEWPKLISPDKNCVWLSEILFDSILTYMVERITKSLGSNDLINIAMAQVFNNLTKNSVFRNDLKGALTNAICTYFKNPTEAAKYKGDLENVIKRVVKKKYTPHKDF